MNPLSLRERMLGGLWGALTGDALGVPGEFQDRASLRRNPVTGMRAYGTHRQPAGTWSDDSSLLLCSVESSSGLAVGMASARQCLQARPQDWVISQYTSIGFLEKSGAIWPMCGAECSPIMTSPFS